MLQLRLACRRAATHQLQLQGCIYTEAQTSNCSCSGVSATGLDLVSGTAAATAGTHLQMEMQDHICSCRLDVAAPVGAMQKCDASTVAAV